MLCHYLIPGDILSADKLTSSSSVPLLSLGSGFNQISGQSNFPARCPSQERSSEDIHFKKKQNAGQIDFLRAVSGGGEWSA